LVLNFELTEEQELIRKSIRGFCESRYPNSYWRDLDRRHEYPEAFVRELTLEGFLSCLIPKEYGGSGLGVLEASIVLEEINRSGGNSAACHAQMYTMGTLLRHGSEAQKKQYLPKIAKGELRLQTMAITEPEAGIDTSRIRTNAVRKDGSYVIHGHKIFASRLQHSDLILLLARTTPYEQVSRKTDGLSIFLIDLRKNSEGIRYQQIDTMINHEPMSCSSKIS